MADLGALDRQVKDRENARIARRGVGQSRVGVRKDPVVLPAETPEPLAAPTVADAPTVKAAAKEVKQETSAVDNTLAPATISLDRATEHLLESVRTAGRFSSPRLDANRSATVRLALTILGETMSPEEIVAEMRRRGAQSAGTGRKRFG